MTRALMVLSLLCSTPLLAQSPNTRVPQSRITRDSAQRLALAVTPGGRVRSGELEREHGKLIYSFDISVTGKTGIDEVQIDAITGATVSNVHETPAMEAAEAAADRRAPRRPTAAKKP
jgi:hypothetical protein